MTRWKERDGDHAEDDMSELAGRLAKPLRRPERVGPGFRASVMADVRTMPCPLAGVSEGDDVSRPAVPLCIEPAQTAEASHAGRRRAWMGAGGALLLAAGVAAFAVLGNRNNNAPAHGAATTAAVPDTVYMVRFVFVAPEAASVALVGDFNHWNRGETLLASASRDGVWTVSLPLAAGRHEYAFIVNGTEWTSDPAATRVLDDWGTESSVVTVGQRQRAPST